MGAGSEPDAMNATPQVNNERIYNHGCRAGSRDDLRPAICWVGGMALLPQKMADR